MIVDGGGFDWSGDERYPGLSRPAPALDGLVIGETCGNFAFVTACRVLGLRDLGPTLSAADASAILDGFETLPLRMCRHCETALAHGLERHGRIAWVRYAGLPGDPGHALVRRLRPIGCATGAGGTRSLFLSPADPSGGRTRPATTP